MIQTHPFNVPHMKFSPLGGAGTYSSILSCASDYDPVQLERSGGADRSHLLAGGAFHPESKDVRSMLPKAILQTFVDDIGKTVMDDHFDAYATMVDLPLTIMTSSARLKIDTLEDLQEGFDAFTDMLQGIGVTEMLRTVKNARFQGNDHIVGIYESRLMKGDRQAVPTFHSKAWIGLHGGTWKLIRVNNTTNDSRWPMLLTRLAPPPWPLEET